MRMRILDALAKAIVTSALLHVSTRIAEALKSGDADVLNYFRIVELDAFLPVALTTGGAASGGRWLQRERYFPCFCTATGAAHSFNNP